MPRRPPTPQAGGHAPLQGQPPPRQTAVKITLARRGDLGQLRARADAGDWHAAERLTGLLVHRGDLDGAEQVLRAAGDAGDGNGGQLAELLAGRNQGEVAKRLLRFGLAPDGSVASR
jgi:hypothetical protein